MHDFQYSSKFRITLLRQRLVKALPAKTRSLRDFCHALCAGNIAQSNAIDGLFADVFSTGNLFSLSPATPFMT